MGGGDLIMTNILRTKLIPGGEGVFIFTTNGVLCVPFNPENSDYQKYLRWLAKGNTPEPADDLTNNI
jgi:hypothetical protein